MLLGTAPDSRDEVALLRESLARIHRIADKVPSMLAFWDPDQRCRYANAAYEEWFGVTPAALIGKTLEELLALSPQVARTA